MVSYLKSASPPRWVPDNARVSYNTPIFRGKGSGTPAVTLLKDAVTEGFTATYDLAKRKWTLVGTSGQKVSVQKGGAVPPGTTWELALGTKVKVVITQGRVAFANGDKFIFSIFKTSAPKGKKNEIGLGSFDVKKGP